MDLYESDIQTKLDTLNNDPLDSSGVDTFMSEVTGLHTDITAEFYSVTPQSDPLLQQKSIRISGSGGYFAELSYVGLSPAGWKCMNKNGWEIT
jgi:hypothetical protein